MAGFTVRPAKPEDASVLAGLMYLAAEGGYTTSGYDISLGGTRSHQISELSELAVTKARSWFHYSHFVVAETEGSVVACAAGFKRMAADEAIPPALLEIGWSPRDVIDLNTRLAPIAEAFPPDPPNAWTIAHVAVLPDWRRSGLGKKCVEAVVECGRREGLSLAQLDVFTGNPNAIKLYKALGFGITGTFGNAAFRSLLQRDPIHRMTKPL